MPRKPERYQLPLDFARREHAADRAVLELLAHASSRHIRLVREEIIVTAPSIAAQHLLKSVFFPFNQFSLNSLSAKPDQVQHGWMNIHGSRASIAS